MVLSRAKCISNFLEEDELPTIEPFDIQNYFFECDICQDACPWNETHLKNPLATPMGSAFTSYKDEILDLFSFHRLMAMDEAEYSEYILPHIFGFDLSYEMFKRNVQLAYNS